MDEMKRDVEEGQTIIVSPVRLSEQMKEQAVTMTDLGDSCVGNV